MRHGEGIDAPHEAGCLAPKTAKARMALKATPRWALAEAVRRTMSWYRDQAEGAAARALCDVDVSEYEALP